MSGWPEHEQRGPTSSSLLPAHLQPSTESSCSIPASPLENLPSWLARRVSQALRSAERSDTRFLRLGVAASESASQAMSAASSLSCWEAWRCHLTAPKMPPQLSTLMPLDSMPWPPSVLGSQYQPGIICQPCETFSSDTFCAETLQPPMARLQATPFGSRPNMPASCCDCRCCAEEAAAMRKASFWSAWAMDSSSSGEMPSRARREMETESEARRFCSKAMPCATREPRFGAALRANEGLPRSIMGLADSTASSSFSSSADSVLFSGSLSHGQP
mmetsp:Transcript_3215/g.9028  ORF Transcript_3215/g.9028 Transcript_3215/m.9028 type:complete len:274 (+) Transcript_3215:255-1076(+)